jgi:UrcA family protein
LKSSTSEIAVKHLKAVLIGALILCPLSSGLAAAASNDARTKVVRFADLDLTHPAGAQELYRRIRRAAREVCEPDGTTGYLESYGECLRGAIAHAVLEVDAPLLTEYQSHLYPAIPQPQPAE